MDFTIQSTPYQKEYESILKNFISPKLSLGKRVDLIKNNEHLWKIDVFVYERKDNMKFVQKMLLDIWASYLENLEKSEIS